MIMVLDPGSSQIPEGDLMSQDTCQDWGGGLTVWFPGAIREKGPFGEFLFQIPITTPWLSAVGRNM